MADNLEIFGEVYPSAIGIKAKDTNGVTQTFVKPSGTKNITSSGNTDVTAYATASVAAGTATAPASITGTSATVSTGTNTLTLSKTISVTPSVTAGYVSGGTAGNSSVSLTANITTKGATTYTPTTTQQTIASGTYLTGTQTIDAIPSQYIVPSGTLSITENGTFNVSSYASVEVDAATTYTATITHTGVTSLFSNDRVNYNSVSYYENGATFTYTGGEAVSFALTNGGTYIKIDGKTVGTTIYSTTLPKNDISVAIYTSSTGNSYINVTTNATTTLTENGTYLWTELDNAQTVTVAIPEASGVSF